MLQDVKKPSRKFVLTRGLAFSKKCFTVYLVIHTDSVNVSFEFGQSGAERLCKLYGAGHLGGKFLLRFSIAHRTLKPLCMRIESLSNLAAKLSSYQSAPTTHLHLACGEVMRNKYHWLAMSACLLVFMNCRERPQESRETSAPRREHRERHAAVSALNETRQIPFSGQTALVLEVEYTGGYLDLEADTSGALADLLLDYDNEELRPEISFDSSSDTPVLKIRSPHDRRENMSLDDLRNNRWKIKVSRQVLLTCEIEAGAVDAWLNFSGLQLEGLDLNVGAGEMELEFRERNPAKPRMRLNAGAAAVTASGLCNANFESFKFNGGAGKSELFFDGDYEGEGRVELKFGVGLNTVRLAKNLGARIRKSGSFLAPMSIRGFDKDGDYYYSPNYERAANRLDFEIEMGVGHTSIKWIEERE